MAEQEKYNHQSIEKKWQDRWEKEGIYQALNESKKPKFYCLIEFPYPSADGLHVGHPRSYTAIDILARKKRMEGYNVLFPIGFDAFGLPTENYAIKVKKNPADITKTNINRFRKQLKALGLSFDWSREVITTNPKYYKWTQWIFLQLYKAGLVYQKEMPINWCPSCKIGLANEEVVDCKCERCSHVVGKKNLKQWLFRITKYAQRLIDDLEKVDYLDKIKTQQINWIGRSEGAKVKFPITNFRFQNSSQIPSPKKRKLAIIVHGSPSKENYPKQNEKHWLPWLAEELEKIGYKVVRPEMPRADKPDYNEWKRKLKETLGGYKVDENALLVGHSAGCSFLVRYLSENNLKADRLMMIAPSKIISKDEKEIYARLHNFYNFEPKEKIANQVVIFYSTDDRESINLSVSYYADFYNAEIKKFTDRGHFTQQNKKNTKLPEAIEWLKEDYSLEVFTTRPDTLFGVTYMVVAPEHGIIKKYSSKIKNLKEVLSYIKQAQAKSDLERRTEPSKEKTGVELKGIKAINPATKKEIPIWVADYVLMGYGTGAIMAVPAHDVRDFQFAQKYNIKIVPVIQPDKNVEIIPGQVFSETTFKKTQKGELSFYSQEPHKWDEREIRDKLNNGELCYTGEGKMVNSGKFNGIDSLKCIEKITKWLEKKKLGKKATNYKLRDWIFSRQHYWGEPIPLIHCEKCGVQPVPEEDLPVKLPKVKNYEPTDTGESPLAAIKDWVNTTCPKCGGKAQRETDTMPNWAGSSWYFIRYVDPHNNREFASKKSMDYWLPVDIYNGGMEHTTLHLLYSRFWYKALYDFKLVPGPEPYAKRISHGMVLAEDGKKMSKSLGNVVNPDAVVKEYGADAMRMYEMFMGPFSEAIPWDTKGIVGVRRFLDRVYGLVARGSWLRAKSPKPQAQSPKLRNLLHRTIKKVTNDIENFHFNTAVASLMTFTNRMAVTKNISPDIFKKFLVLLSPFAPHLTEELWQKLGHKDSIFKEKWPEHDEKLAQAKEVEFVIQINGKVRDKVKLPAEVTEKEILQYIESSKKIKKYTAGKKIIKKIFVPGKLLNIVLK